MSETPPPTIKKQYGHCGWEITVYSDGNIEMQPETLPQVDKLELKPRLPYKAHAKMLKKKTNNEVCRLGLNFLLYAKELLK
jgi:hypothetical protein